MPDMTNVPAGVPPEDYASFINAQRQQMLANALMQGSMAPIQQPETTPVKGLYYQPRTGGVQVAAKLAEALMGRSASDKAIKANAALQQSLNQAYAPGGQQTSPGIPLQAAPAPSDPNSQDVAPAVQRLPGASLAQTVQATQPTFAPQNPRNPQGLPADVVRNLAMYDPKSYASMLQGPEAVQLARAGGIDPATAARAALNKATALQSRPGETVSGLQGTSIAADPSKGVSYRMNPDGTVTSVPIANDAQIQAAREGLDTAQRNLNTPHYEPDPFHPGQVRVSYPPAGPALAGPQPPALAGSPAPAPQSAGTAPLAPQGPAGPAGSGPVPPPGAPQAPHPAAPPSVGSSAGNTALALEQQKQAGKSGAESGQNYADQLVKNAVSSTEVRRSLSELRNLSQSATPNASNAARLQGGALMVAMGMSPQTASSALGVNLDSLTAAAKQTGSLALDSIHDMTSRGTNFDLATFMKYNPNLDMATPGGFSRVLDFMDRRMQQEIAKQADFAQWSQNVPSNQWSTGHTAHWLQLQNQLINQGKTNSRPPLSSFDTPAAGSAP